MCISSLVPATNLVLLIRWGISPGIGLIGLRESITMEIEDAIILLSKRAEYAQQKADTPDKQRKAADYIEVVNTIIEYYNNTEKLQDTNKNLQELIRVICGYIGIKTEDIERLIQTDIQFIKRRFDYWKESSGNLIILFHRVAFDCYAVYDAERTIQELKEYTIPYLTKRDSEEKSDISFKALQLAKDRKDYLEDFINSL